MKVSEKVGFLAGYPLGLGVALISFIRASRMFHPEGIVVDVKVRNISPWSLFKEDAFMRFSSAWWKKKEWRDVLGIAIRFSDEQDLLFASFKHPWQTPFGPFLTKYKNFFENRYYAVSPFKYQNKEIIFRLSPGKWFQGGQNRTDSLLKNIEQKATFLLEVKEQEGPWTKIAEITLQSIKELDQKKLRFNPFLNGLEIYPKGFIHYLRIGVYSLGQFARTLR